MVLAPQTSDRPKLLLKPGRWTIGSAATCSYRVVGAGVQPRHALILCGGQSVVLKTWDAKTWCNGLPVRGEVKLHGGDTVVIGSVEFQVESAGITEVLEQLPDARLQTSTVYRDEPPALDQPQGTAFADELAELESLRSRVNELEQIADEATQQTEQSRQDEQLARAELTQQSNDWLSQQSVWNDERSSWESERAAMSAAQQRLSLEIEQQHAEATANAARWQAEREQQQAE